MSSQRASVNECKLASEQLSEPRLQSATLCIGMHARVDATTRSATQGHRRVSRRDRAQGGVAEPKRREFFQAQARRILDAKRDTDQWADADRRAQLEKLETEIGYPHELTTPWPTAENSSAPRVP